MTYLGLFYSFANALTQRQKQGVILGVDIALIVVSYALARALVIGHFALWNWTSGSLIELGALLVAGTTVILLLGLHKIKLNAYQMQGVVETGGVAAVLFATGMLTNLLTMSGGMPSPVFAVSAMCFLILSVWARLVMRRALLWIYRRGSPRMPILIYGAGQTGQQLASALATDTDVEPMAFVDDDPRLHGLTIAGLRVHPASEIDELEARHGIKRVVIAMPSADRAVRNRISERLTKTCCEVHVLPSFADLVTKTARSLSDTKPVDINDLLGREGLEDDLPGVSDCYSGRNVLVTGAGGSIGSELCRQLVLCGPASLTLLDHSELALFEIDRELRAMGTDVQINAVLGSVTDAPLVQAAIADNKVHVVLHAAAYKHVPMVQDNALEGVKNNVFGTKTVADAARALGVERFILVSTDKAVRPTSVMGASKRFAELLIQDLATRSEDTRFSMVRFGNVLGSSGSVIPLFHEQISRGGPVTLTDPEVTRFFMTIPEAVQLVLLAGSFARGGDVFVLDMGQPVKIYDLARKMIESAGHSVRDDDNPAGDIEIKVTGLRPGEKLYEELLIGSDMLTTPHSKILRAQESLLSEIETAKALQSLRNAIDTRDTDLLLQTVATWIETVDGDEAKTVNE